VSAGDKEYDMIIMRHDVGVRWPDGKRDTHHIDLVVYGDQDHAGGFSAMAKTVGYPTAIATEMVLQGEWNLTNILPYPLLSFTQVNYVPSLDCEIFLPLCIEYRVDSG